MMTKAIIMMMMICSDVSDIHAVLEVFVFDENPDKKVDFLGKIAIPLLRVRLHQPIIRLSASAINRRLVTELYTIVALV